MFSQSDTALTSVLETMVDGVIMIDKAGVIQMYNAACQTIFGYTFEEVVGKNVEILMPSPYRENHDDYIANYQRTQKAKIIGIGRQVSGQRKDGEVFPMYLSVGENKASGQSGYVGIIRDMTKETQSAEKYNQLQHEYFHLSRVAAMNQMGTAIAHELNQPLAAVMNYIQAAQISLDNPQSIDKYGLRKIMEKSAEQIERAAATLSSLRRFIQTGEHEKKPFDLAGVFSTSLNLALINFKTHNISISEKRDDELPMVIGSDIQIQQVLVNLIRNACEATELSEVKGLSLTATLEDKNFIKVGVSDTGVGLSGDTMQTLFEPFSSDKKNGLGVGLSISHSIISNHGGRLWAENNPEGGSVFYFTLPVAVT